MLLRDFAMRGAMSLSRTWVIYVANDPQERNTNHPDGRYGTAGFRVVRSPPIRRVAAQRLAD